MGRRSPEQQVAEAVVARERAQAALLREQARTVEASRREQLPRGIASVLLVDAGPKPRRVVAALHRRGASWQDATDLVGATPIVVSSDLTERDASVLAASLRRAGAVAEVEGAFRSPASELEKLAALHDRGALTDDEFAAMKAQFLG